MIQENDRVVLTKPFAEEGLEPGDIGAVVHVYPRHEAYEVEFVTLTGKTAAVVTVAAEHVRPEDLRAAVLVSADLARHAAWLAELGELGFEEIHLHHVGQELRPFIETFGSRVLPELGS